MSNGRVVQVGTRNVGKLHEVMQAHLISFRTWRLVLKCVHDSLVHSVVGIL
jgi:hypothetical protein